MLFRSFPAGSPERLAGRLVGYHMREARPAWWRYFARRDAEHDELLDDGECIAGLVPTGEPPTPDARSLRHAFTYPEQEHAFGAGTSGDDPATAGSLEVVEVDLERRSIVLKRGPKWVDATLPAALIPGGPLRTGGQRAALQRLAVSLRDGTGAYPALEGIQIGRAHV